MATSQKLSMNDLWSMQSIGEVALSPDGRQVAFVMQRADKTKNETGSTIFLLQLDEHGYTVGEARQLTNGNKHDSNPVWAPDSRRLLFLSDREGGKNQLWLLDTAGGEAYQVTTLLRGVHDAAWSPDGRWIAFTAPVALDDEDDVLTGITTLDETTKSAQEKQERLRWHTVTKTWYRSDGRNFFSTFSQLFIVPAPTVEDRFCDPHMVRRLTRGEVDYSQPMWTPDSQEIGVISRRSLDSERAFRDDLWAIQQETAEARCLTDGDLFISSYAWSPDGKAAVVVGMQHPLIDGFKQEQLYLVTRQGNSGDRVLRISPDFAKEAGIATYGAYGQPGPYRPVWSANGQHIYFLVTEHGTIQLYRLDMVWRSIVQLTTGAGMIACLALLPNEQGLLLVEEREEQPWEFYRLPLSETGAGESERLTHIYDRWLAERQWGKVEYIGYKGVNNDDIDGWLIHPVGEREGIKYPLLVRIHGGPNGSFSIGTTLDPVSHYFAALGYAIFFCNPHGSTGYGESFMAQVAGDWGGWDFQDILLGVDTCIAHGIADPERLLVTGHSYGGYMSMFIVGHSDRFKAAAPVAGISNLESIVGTSDLGFWFAWEAKGYPWEPERAGYYRERSPLTAAHNVTTPTLIMHGENDLRCPIEQAEQFYITLKTIGKAPVEFVRIPGAWHSGEEKPGQWISVWERIAEWFEKYIDIRPDEYN